MLVRYPCTPPPPETKLVGAEAGEPVAGVGLIRNGIPPSDHHKTLGIGLL